MHLKVILGCLALAGLLFVATNTSELKKPSFHMPEHHHHQSHAIGPKRPEVDAIVDMMWSANLSTLGKAFLVLLGKVAWKMVEPFVQFGVKVMDAICTCVQKVYHCAERHGTAASIFIFQCLLICFLLTRSVPEAHPDRDMEYKRNLYALKYACTGPEYQRK